MGPSYADDAQPAAEEVTKKPFVSTYDRIKDKEITPVYGPFVSEGGDIYVEASYIYWYMNELGLNYAGTNSFLNGVYYNGIIGDVSTPNFTPPAGRVYTPGNKASSGFKVGAGMDFDYDGWDSRVNYTWYRNHHASSVSTTLKEDGFGDLIPDRNINSLYSSNQQKITEYNDITTLLSASNEFKLALNVIDWEVGRSFFISPKLALRTHLGMKASWGHQYSTWINRNASTDSGEAEFSIYPNDVATTADITLTSFNKQGNWGFGARCGLDTAWMIADWFSFFGECSVTSLWQYFRTTRTDVYNGFEDDSNFNNWTDLSYHQRLHMVNPVVETQIGMRVDYMFSDDEYRFRLQAGWESQVWFDQNTFLNEFGANHAYGKLMLQGLTLNVRLDF